VIKKSTRPSSSVIGYLRVSTADQNLEKNKADILQLANHHDLGRVIGDQLLSEFESISGSIRHKPSKGRAREQSIVAEYLSIYLPKNIGISNGEIVTANGQVSPECDCVIYDSMTCPFLIEKQNYRVFPVEAVFGVVEIKSKLDDKELKKSFQNLAKIKGFQKTAYGINASDFGKTIQLYDQQWDYFPTFGAIFAYDSKDLAALASSMNALGAEKAPYERTNLVCVLKKGCIVNQVTADGKIDPAPSSRTTYRAVATENPLLLATIFLQERFLAAWNRPTQLREYLPHVSYGRFIT
jgi:hypothetical protein